MTADIQIYAAVEQNEKGWVGTINVEVNGEVVETYASNKTFSTESECWEFTRQAFNAIAAAMDDDLTVH